MNPALPTPLHFFPEERCPTAARTQTVHRTVSILSASSLLPFNTLPARKNIEVPKSGSFISLPGKSQNHKLPSTDRLSFTIAAGQLGKFRNVASHIAPLSKKPMGFFPR